MHHLIHYLADGPHPTCHTPCQDLPACFVLRLSALCSLLLWLDNASTVAAALYKHVCVRVFA